MNQDNPTLLAYSEMQQAFDYYNEQLFDGKLPQCLITFQRERRTHGYFSEQRFINRDDNSMTDEIAMNPSFFGITPLSEIMQTLVHVWLGEHYPADVLGGMLIGCLPIFFIFWGNNSRLSKTISTV